MNTDATGPRTRVTVIGIGYLGLTHAVCLAEFGHDVLAVDTDARKVAQAASGIAPFFEPGLQELLRKQLDTGRLRFTTSHAEAASFADIHFLCVGTPQAPDGSADLSQVYAAADTLAPHLATPCLIAGKSTVPVGTARALAARIAAQAPAGAAAEVIWNPEFLREGSAVRDSLMPDRIVLGTMSQPAADRLRQVYARPLSQGVPVLVMDLETAELVKMSANAFLATRLSFINALAEVCEATGADVTALAGALAYDERIGRRFLTPGLGYGGGCLPKDVRAFGAVAEQLGITSLATLLTEIDVINMRCRSRTVELARELVGGSLAGRRVGVLGLAFKPDSDDIRDSPALAVATEVHARGAQVTAYDPVAMDRARRAHPELDYAGSILGAAAEADVLLLLTEWPEFSQADPEVIGKAVSRRNIADGRNVLNAGTWRAAGWTYRALGRG